MNIAFKPFSGDTPAPSFVDWIHPMKNPLLFSVLLISAFPMHAQESASSTVVSSELNEAEACRTHMVTPIYPINELRYGRQGTVVLEATIDTTGKVIKVKVVKSSKYSSLDLAAITAVKSSTFCPAHKDGKPIGGTITLPIRFTANVSG